jgi:pyruvate dehydrogenase E1 component alpha subunit
MSDAQHYRTKEEVEEYRKIDPISQVKEVILTKKYATQKDLDIVDKSIKERVLECEKFAESSPYPDLSLMYDAVYEQDDYPFIKHKL